MLSTTTKTLIILEQAWPLSEGSIQDGFLITHKYHYLQLSPINSNISTLECRNPYTLCYCPRLPSTVVLPMLNCHSATLNYRIYNSVTTEMKFRLVFWDVLPCKMTVDRCFRGVYCLHYQGWVYPRRQLWTSLQDCFQNGKNRWERCIKSEVEYFEGDKTD
jgi:hypothetical protein